MKHLVPAAVLLAAVIVAAWHFSARPKPVVLVPTLTGQPEYCLTCHADLPEISRSHPVASFGCVRCHGGERLALEAGLAHSTMRGGANPSDLSVVEESCGGSSCHSGDPAADRDHIQRVQASLQATYAGAIASIRYSFGAQPDLQAQQGVTAVAPGKPYRSPVGDLTGSPGSLALFDARQESAPSVLAFAGNCLYCHLYAQPVTGPGGDRQVGGDGLVGGDRMTGCAACHSPGAGTNRNQQVHSLTTAIPYTQCNACHNRGNYDLRTMKFLPRSDQPADRLHDYYQPIAQFTRCEYELDCIDCHTRLEVMGDGHIYNNQKAAQYMQCRDCHGTLDEAPRTVKLTNPDDISLRQAFLNPVVDLKVGDEILVTSQGEPVWNTAKEPDGSLALVAKTSGRRYNIPLVQGSACQQKPDQQESRYCHACHAVEK